MKNIFETFYSTLLCTALMLSTATLTKLVEVTKINPNIKIDLPYATENNFTHKAVYKSARCFLTEEAAQALSRVQQLLEKKGLGLKIWDGYRPLSVQKIFWDLVPDERYVADPKKVLVIIVDVL